VDRDAEDGWALAQKETLNSVESEGNVFESRREPIKILAKKNCY
jgi:hypothetical protein